VSEGSISGSSSSKLKKENEALKKRVKELEGGVKAFQQVSGGGGGGSNSTISDPLLPPPSSSLLLLPPPPPPPPTTTTTTTTTTTITTTITTTTTTARMGDYDIGEKIGEGQFATVYHCYRRGAKKQG